jgi:hypothetical protein
MSRGPKGDYPRSCEQLVQGVDNRDPAGSFPLQMRGLAVRVSPFDIENSVAIAKLTIAAPCRGAPVDLRNARRYIGAGELLDRPKTY